MRTPKSEPIYPRLVRLRKAAGLTVSEVSRLIGVPASTYREWEYGRTIKGEPYLKLADVFGISVVELLGRIPTTPHELQKKASELKKLCLEIEKLAQSLK